MFLKLSIETPFFEIEFYSLHFSKLYWKFMTKRTKTNGTYFSKRSPNNLEWSESNGWNISSICKILPYPFLNSGIVHVKNNMEKTFARSRGFGKYFCCDDSIFWISISIRFEFKTSADVFQIDATGTVIVFSSTTRLLLNMWWWKLIFYWSFFFYQNHSEDKIVFYLY